jgi:hypothetical protein
MFVVALDLDETLICHVQEQAGFTYAEGYKRIYINGTSYLIYMRKGVKELLTELKSHSEIKCVLYTISMREWAFAVLCSLGIIEYFDEIHTRENLQDLNDKCLANITDLDGVLVDNTRYSDPNLVHVPSFDGDFDDNDKFYPAHDNVFPNILSFIFRESMF